MSKLFSCFNYIQLLSIYTSNNHFSTFVSQPKKNSIILIPFFCTAIQLCQGKIFHSSTTTQSIFIFSLLQYFSSWFLALKTAHFFLVCFQCSRHFFFLLRAFFFIHNSCLDFSFKLDISFIFSCLREFINLFYIFSLFFSI